jgi:hypothetical protein
MTRPGSPDDGLSIAFFTHDISLGDASEEVPHVVW